MTSQSQKRDPPKFGSFRLQATHVKVGITQGHSPGPQPVPEEATDTYAKQRHRLGKHGSKGERRHSYTKEHRQHYKRGHHRHADQEVKNTSHRPEPIVAAWDEDSPLYMVDRRGDTQNTVCGKPHKYNVPAYKREGAGGVLGYGNNWKIDRSVSNEQSLVIGKRGNHNNLGGPENLLSTTYGPKTNRRHRLIHATQKVEELDCTADFISLSSGNKRRKCSPLSGPEEGNDVELDYKAVKDTPNVLYRPSDSDAETEPSSSDQEQSDCSTKQETLIQAENVRLSRLVKDEPNNITAWIQLIAHQNHVASQGRDINTLKTSEKRALSEVKIATYEGALKSVGKDIRGREGLLLKLMEEGCQIWDGKTIARKWQDALMKNPNAVSLRLRYIDFCQSDPLMFRYDDCRIGMLDAMRTFKLLEDSKSYKQDAENIPLMETQVYVFLRLTRFILESGYQEYAWALWQGAIEFYLFRPTALDHLSKGSTSRSELLKCFESFWDEEVPRFGEVNAHGWSIFYEEGGTAISRDTTNVTSLIDVKDCTTDLTATEKRFMRGLREPGRTVDETDHDDPYHIILSTDIVSVLALLPNSLDHDILIDAFMCFCQLPPVPNFQRPSSRQKWWVNPFLRNDLLEDTGIQDSAGYQEQEQPWRCCLSFCRTTLEILLSPAGIPRALSVPVNWLQHSLRALTDSLPLHDSLPEYLLAFEYLHDPEKAKRVAKALLKKRSSSLRLWNAYAMGEYHAGHAETADDVISTAIRMSKTLPEAVQEDAVLILRTWIWDALRRLDPDLAFNRAIATIESYNNISLMVNKSVDDHGKEQALIEGGSILQRKQLEALSAGQHQRFVGYTECLAFVAYLPGMHLKDALFIFQSTMELVASWNLCSAPVAEHLHQAKAQLIAYHISRGKSWDHGSICHLPNTQGFERAWSYDATEVRKTLRESLAQFPDNTILLSAHTVNELRFPIVERDTAVSNFSRSPGINAAHGLKRETMSYSSRGVYGESTMPESEEPSIVRYLYNVLMHTARLRFQHDERSATIYKLRSVFQRSIQSRRAKHNAGLWTLYLKFEIHLASVGRDLQKARAVFFQGLRVIPWCKAFVILGLEGLRLQTNNELKGVWETMVERELRVYVDLMPLLEQADKSQSITDQSHRERRKP